MKIETTSNTPIALILASFIIIIAGLMNAVNIINPILMGLFVSIICAQPIGWLKSKKVPQTLALIIVLIGITAFFVGFTEIIGASLSSFKENTGVYEDHLKKMGAILISYFDSKGIPISLDKISNVVDVSKVMNVTSTLLSSLGSIMGSTLTIFFLAVFLLLELEIFQLKTKIILKNSNNSHVYISTIIKNIRDYLSIKTGTSLLTGILIWIFLTILGVDYAVIWALIAFLLNYIPNIGSIIAAFPAMLFSLVQLGFSGVIWTTVIFLAVNTLIGSIIEPKVMGKGLGLSTYVVFVSLLFWGFVLGTVGMFLSVPLTMALKIALEQNKKTKWIAILLGSDAEALAIAKAENIE
jgi:predicted PurR-regulated permease PerM